MRTKWASISGSATASERQSITVPAAGRPVKLISQQRDKRGRRAARVKQCRLNAARCQSLRHAVRQALDGIHGIDRHGYDHAAEGCERPGKIGRSVPGREVEDRPGHRRMRQQFRQVGKRPSGALNLGEATGHGGSSRAVADAIDWQVSDTFQAPHVRPMPAGHWHSSAPEPQSPRDRAASTTAFHAPAAARARRYPERSQSGCGVARVGFWPGHEHTHVGLSFELALKLSAGLGEKACPELVTDPFRILPGAGRRPPIELTAIRAQDLSGQRARNCTQFRKRADWCSTRSVERGEEGALARYGGGGVGVIERRNRSAVLESSARISMAMAPWAGAGGNWRGSRRLLIRSDLPSRLSPAAAKQRCVGNARLKLCQPRVDIAAEGHDFEIGAFAQHLCSAADRRRSELCALRQVRNRAVA